MRFFVRQFGEVSSTQALARDECTAGRLDRATVFVARTQTGGVGRFGRKWSSPGGGLWCTIATPFERPVTGALGLCLGAALVGLLRAELNTDAVRLKWPNDAVIGGKKVGGVLVESIAAGSARWLLIGVGVNANFPLSALPSELHESATTLADNGLELNLDEIPTGLALVLLGSAHPGPLQTGQLEQISDLLWGVGRPGRWSGPDGQRTEGVFRGIDESGRALIETPGGVVALHSAVPDDRAGT